MKKYILIWLLIIGPNFMHAMKNDALIHSSFSFFSSSSRSIHISSESQLLLNLRKDVQHFKDQLHISESIEADKTLMSSPDNQQMFSLKSSDPMVFMRYCYYQKFRKNSLKYFSKIWRSPALVTKDQAKNQILEINGYSVVGAAMMTKERSIQEKRDFIRELINCDFKATQKDKKLEKLILHDGIANHKNIFLHLSHPSSNISCSLFEEKIRKSITNNLLKLFKNEFWLLPKKSSLMLCNQPLFLINCTCSPTLFTQCSYCILEQKNIII